MNDVADIDATPGSTAHREPALRGQTIVVIGGSAGSSSRPRATRAPMPPRSSSTAASTSGWRRRSVRSTPAAPRCSTPTIPINTALTGATYDVDGGQQLLA